MGHAVIQGKGTILHAKQVLANRGPVSIFVVENNSAIYTGSHIFHNEMGLLNTGQVARCKSSKVATPY